MNLDHINISAPAKLLLSVKDFYCDVLGFDEGFRPAFSRPGYWLYSGDKPLIHLIESDAHFQNEKQGYLDHIAFHSSGLADFLKQLKAHQVKYKTSYIKETNLTQIFCKDPSGTGVEIGFPSETI